MVFESDDDGDGFADEALQQKYGFEDPKCCCMNKLAHKIMCHNSLWTGCGCCSLGQISFPFWCPVTGFYSFFLCLTCFTHIRVMNHTKSLI